MKIATLNAIHEQKRSLLLKVNEPMPATFRRLLKYKKPPAGGITPETINSLKGSVMSYRVLYDGVDEGSMRALVLPCIRSGKLARKPEIGEVFKIKFPMVSPEKMKFTHVPAPVLYGTDNPMVFVRFMDGYVVPARENRGKNYGAEFLLPDGRQLYVYNGYVRNQK